MSIKNTLIKHIVYFKKTREKYIYFEALTLTALISMYYYIHPEFNRSVLKAVKAFFESSPTGDSLITTFINYFTIAFPLVSITLAYFNTSKYPQKLLRTSVLLNNMVINLILINILAIGLAPINVADLSLDLHILYRHTPVILVLALITLYSIVIRPLIPLDLKISIKTRDTVIPLDLLRVINNREPIELSENEQLEIEIIGSRRYVELIEILTKNPSITINKEIRNYYKKYTISTLEETILQIVLKESEKVDVLFELIVKPLVTRRVFEPVSTIKDSKLITLILVIAPKVKRVIELRYPRDKPLGEYIVAIVSEELKRKISLDELDIRTVDNKPVYEVDKVIPDNDMTLYIYFKTVTYAQEPPIVKAVETAPPTSPKQEQLNIDEKIDELLKEYELRIREEVW